MSINHNDHHNTLPLNLMILMYGYVAMMMTARCLPFDADLSADVEVPIRRLKVLRSGLIESNNKAARQAESRPRCTLGKQQS